MSNTSLLSGNERTFREDQIIVSKTDTKGRITYANDMFLQIADYTESEVIGQPHSLIRHPFMPRCIFKLLWETVSSNNELFAYVVNKTKFGDYYWVLAHVTPSHDNNGNIVGYHSNRRKPNPEAVNIITPLYARLKEIEDSYSNSKEGLNKSFAMLADLMETQEMRYDMFMYKMQQLQAGDTTFAGKLKL